MATFIPERPLVSIITPTFNRAPYLRETIQSVLEQDYENIEHLIIDDGSTDTTKHLIQEYKDHKNIRYFYQDNSGQNIARNLGLKEAKGDFICFLDSDDKFLTDKVSRSLSAFENHPDVDVVYGDYIFIDKNGDLVNGQNMQRHSGFITLQLLKDNCVSMNTTMVRAEAIRDIGGFSKHVKVADDYDLWLRLSVRSKFLYISERLSAYRLMPNQISSNKLARFKSNEEIIKRFIVDNPALLSSREIQDTLNAFYTRAARHFSGEKDFRLANHYLKKALNTKRFSRRTWRTVVRHILNRFK